MSGIDENLALQTALDHHKSNRLADAEAIYRRILSQNPNHADALHLLGVIARQAGHIDAAIDLITRSIALKPENAEALNNLGHILSDKGRFEESLALLRRAIELNPILVEAHSNLGNVLRALSRLDEAIAAHRRAVELRPDNAQVQNDLAIVLEEIGRPDEAIPIFERAIQLDSGIAQIHYNLGNALMARNQFDRAAAAFQQAIRLKPDFAQGLNNLGCALQAKGEIKDAIAYHQRAIALKPDLADAHYNLGMAFLKLGDFQQGWPLHEWRWKATSLPNLPPLSRPQWDGASLNGRTILLYAEQGRGDAIQFIRYAPLVARQGGRVILQCRTELSRLLQTVPGIARIVSPEDPLPEFDLQIPLMSLPLAFNTDIQSIPADVPYLTTDPLLTAQWKNRIDALPGRFKVGLAWAGSPNFKTDQLRSMALQQLSPLFGIPGVDFLSLQKWDARQSGERNLNLIDWTSDLHDFADTAALIAQLNLVISVDTAVAHLAGALAKPVWLLLPYSPDWRWMLDRTNSPWYPTMRLFRQTKHADWSDPANAAAEALKVALS
jgi:tetratricopeptide (TPR) repeat protein